MTDWHGRRSLLVQHKDNFGRAFVDVPCSDTGAWGVNPENKWNHDYGQVLEWLVAVQGDIFARTAPLVKPEAGSCSPPGFGNRQHHSSLLAAIREFRMIPAKSVWDKVLRGVARPCAQPDFLKLLPFAASFPPSWSAKRD